MDEILVNEVTFAGFSAVNSDDRFNLEEIGSELEPDMNEVHPGRAVGGIVIPL